jgi:hypothetical protein
VEALREKDRRGYEVQARDGGDIECRTIAGEDKGVDVRRILTSYSGTKERPIRVADLSSSVSDKAPSP